MSKLRKALSLSIVLVVLVSSMAVFAEDENVDPKGIVTSPPEVYEFI